MNRRYFIWIAAILFLVVTIIAIEMLYFSKSDAAKNPIHIPRGSTLNEMADTLLAHDIISNRIAFLIAARMTGSSGRLQSGWYRFPEGLTIHEVVRALSNGAYRILKKITIPEGATVKMIASILARECSVDSARTMRLARDAHFLSEHAIASTSLEGYLFPDTYDAPESNDPAVFLRVMIRASKNEFTSRMKTRMKEIGKTEHVIRTIASLVEGEAKHDDERARIAGVYYNRLKRNMLLQADPTIQYILRDGPRRLFYKDLEIDSPYNTYKYRGLPPTPINNPGRKSIEAALYPEQHTFLYFVADGTGGHRFSSTPEEHQLAVTQYRKLQHEQR